MDEQLPDMSEIEVVCANCSFPTVTEYDEDGNVIGFREEDAPKTEEAALAAGWADHGLGLNCPKCSLAYLEDLARDEAEGAKTGALTDLGELLDEQFLRSMHPEADPQVIAFYVDMLRHQRLANLRARAGLPTLGGYADPPLDLSPELYEQYRAVGETVFKAINKGASKP